MLLAITVLEISSGQTDKQTNATENSTSPISSAEVTSNLPTSSLSLSILRIFFTLLLGYFTYIWFVKKANYSNIIMDMKTNHDFDYCYTKNTYLNKIRNEATDYVCYWHCKLYLQNTTRIKIQCCCLGTMLFK